MSIQQALSDIQAAIRQHATAPSITLVAVSKYASVGQVLEAYHAGLRDFGENKVQDALEKMAQLPRDMQENIRWHLIGNLQTNKTKKTVGCFALIHSVDSVRLAEALSRHNQAAGLCQPVLLQVNLSADPSRHGFLPDEVGAALMSIHNLEGIVVHGLMGMAPPDASLNQDPERVKAAFCMLKALRDDLAHDLAIDLPELSMGMSHDFTHALACGATIIRIGNYLFKN